MRKDEKRGVSRSIIFIAVALFHFALVFLVAFSYQSQKMEETPPAAVMKLTDLREEAPPPPPAPRPRPDVPVQTTQESIAENMKETDEVPPAVVTAPVQASRETEYLPQHKISVIPKLPEDAVRKNTVYPPMALRAGIEGRAFLELFIDAQGNIVRIALLKEEPEGRGFGEAARRAFNGLKALSPALANGAPVAVRYRYVINFKIR